MIHYSRIEGCGIPLKDVNGVLFQVLHYLASVQPVPLPPFSYLMSWAINFGGYKLIQVMGYYEWLKKGNDKVPHFTKRADRKIMLLAGLWDSVQYEGTPGLPHVKIHIKLLLV